MTSIRLFDTHHVRKHESLNGCWDITFPSDRKPRDYWVPSAWETLPGKECYVGTAEASRRFTAPATGPARLVFGGISHTCEIFLDGEKLGGHHNAYTPFAVTIPSLNQGEHDLKIQITNETGEVSALHVSNDYYNYGGITRPVECHFFPQGICIERVHLTPKYEKGVWTLHAETKLVNFTPKPRCFDFELEVAGRREMYTGIECAPGETFHTAEITFPEADVTPWSPDTPRLYMFTATLSENEKKVDDWCDRTAFRTFSVSGKDVVLNGDPIFLYGFNRHEDHGLFGNALPLEAMVRDIELMKDLGCNAVRTSHYPNDQRFLDLCDQNGILVWEENHARGLSLEQMKHPRFREQCKDCIDEMIAWHFNHPSIVMWGILNECASGTDEGRAMYAEQFEQIKAMDPSRPTTFASCADGTDVCQDLPDICSWNFYPNWYDDKDPNAEADRFMAYAAEHGGEDKPFIFSEFGGGALLGYLDPVRNIKYSENRQADILRDCLNAVLGRPGVSGAFIWQFCDVRVADEWAVKHGRPRAINDKGVVDEFRRPKMAYQTVKEIFHAFAAGR